MVVSFKSPFSVKIHISVIFDENTRNRVLIFFHGLVLAMTNDEILELSHPLWVFGQIPTALAGAATLPHLPIYPILPCTITLVICHCWRWSWLACNISFRSPNPPGQLIPLPGQFCRFADLCKMSNINRSICPIILSLLPTKVSKIKSTCKPWEGAECIANFDRYISFTISFNQFSPFIVLEG